MKIRLPWTIVAACSFVTVGAPVMPSLGGQASADEQGFTSEIASDSTDTEDTWSSTHFLVQNPSKLTDEEATTIYRTIARDMASRYRLSRNPHAARYQSWRRYVTAPYRTEAHGERYLNVYANSQAIAYGKFERAGVMPVGSVIAKDSYSVTPTGGVNPGPLALIEKMPKGFNPESGDWRFTTIMPDGSLHGTTNGENSERVEFCAECHSKVGDTQDHLYFPPAAYRIID